MTTNPTGTLPRHSTAGARTLCEAFQITAAERPEQVALRTADGRLEITFGEYVDLYNPPDPKIDIVVQNVLQILNNYNVYKQNIQYVVLIHINYLRKQGLEL